MPLPESFLQHLRDFGYHPRSDKHSNALALAMVEDLLDRCRPIAAEAASGLVVYDLNMDLRFSTSTWNVDLVLGAPATPVVPAATRISKATPTRVRIAIEIKGVMTEHRKAVKNRKRDFEAHHEHVHNYDADAIAGAVMVINAASTFQSPLRSAPTAHGTGATLSRLVEHCMTEMRNVTERGAGSAGTDVKTAIVVDFDNQSAEAQYMSASPAPAQGDPLHYDSFIAKLCELYSRRFSQ